MKSLYLSVEKTVTLPGVTGVNKGIKMRSLILYLLFFYKTDKSFTYVNCSILGGGGWVMQIPGINKHDEK